MHRRFNLTFLRILRLDAENYLFAINWNNLKIELAAQKICRSWGKYKNIAFSIECNWTIGCVWWTKLDFIYCQFYWNLACEASVPKISMLSLPKSIKKYTFRQISDSKSCQSKEIIRWRRCRTCESDKFWQEKFKKTVSLFFSALIRLRVSILH